MVKSDSKLDIGERRSKQNGETDPSKGDQKKMSFYSSRQLAVFSFLLCSRSRCVLVVLLKKRPKLNSK